MQTMRIAIGRVSRPLAGGVFMLAIVTVFLLLATGCKGTSQQAYQILDQYDKTVSYYPGERWSAIATPEQAGWSTVRLEQARQFAESIHSSAVVIVENGIIIAAWGDFAAKYNLHSIRKSLMSAMVGIYVEQKLLDPAKTLRELHISDTGGLSPQEEEATILDLLTARSGIYHPAAYETEGMAEKRPPRNSHPPGSFWYYNNWDFNALLTIFNQETRQDFFEQFLEKIGRPLQMEQFSLDDTRYQQEPDSIHPAYLFQMNALDLARFGLLYLRNGSWQGKRIIPENWIRQSTAVRSVFNPNRPERGYGYLWWVNEAGYYASGTGGQRLFIMPDKNLVIVHLADTRRNIRVNAKAIWDLLDRITAARNP